MKTTNYIKKHWNELPKSVFNDGTETKELVIVRQIANWDHGYGHHSYEGIGVDCEGKVFAAYSGGCSCNGDVSFSEIGGDVWEDWRNVDFAALEVSFSSY